MVPGSPRSIILRGENGMTLLELMIVVAIIGTLAAIATPSYMRYLAKIRIQDVVTDMRMIERDLELYHQLHGDYPASLAVFGEIPKDPWGNEYQYAPIAGVKGKGGFRKDRNMVPVNTDFDLYSMGEDGQTKTPFTAPVSKDDIVRANNGEFMGLVSDY